MDIAHSLFLGFGIALTPINLAYGGIGVILGTAIGAMPGIGPTNTVALLLPLTFGMNPISGIILLAGIYYGSQYGGTITSVLVNVPGEASSVVTCIDGHQMALGGRAGAALAVAAVGSFVAGTLGTVALMLLAPPLANFALKFGPPETFAVLLLAFTSLLSMASKSRPRTLVSIVLGLFIATIGSDGLSGRSRFTLGSVNLLGGIDFIQIVIGLFGVSEVLIAFEGVCPVEVLKAELGLRNIFPTRNEWAASGWPIIRGSILGFLVGVLGAGATIASFLSYGLEKGVSRTPDRFGKGAIEGVAGPESANNSATAGAMVPLLALGIPGSATAAVMMGAFMIWGLRPGPLLFQNNADFVWALIASMYIGNVLLVIVNIAFIPAFVRVLRIPLPVLFSSIVVFSIVGSYSEGGSLFDIWTMLGFGILGYVMKKLDFPEAPLVFAVVLGPAAEISLRQALTMSRGDVSILVASPISASFVVATVLMLAIPPAWPFFRRAWAQVKG